MAQAVLAQSQVLTALAAQINQGQTDPMIDLGGISSTGTRGSTGRARLQAELASQKATFYNSVINSMARRMNPTMPVTGSAKELLHRGVCGTRYLERFGGYGRHRDLGLLQFQVMQILDFLQDDNYNGARDATALLAVCIEQAVMDNGKFELASVLCLLDDLPSNIFVNRNAGALSRSKSFAPLADQRWITVSLAYLKELDTIQTKRLEIGATSSKEKTPSTPQPAAKAKGGAKKKGKGKVSSANHVENEEEE